LEGTWKFDQFHEKRTRRVLNELAHFHGCVSLGQLPPGFLNVRIYVAEDDEFQCKLDTIRNDIAVKRPGEDAMFDLRIIAIAADGSRATPYLLSWNQIENAGAVIRMRLSDLEVLQPSKVDLSKVDLMQAAQDLSRLGPVAPQETRDAAKQYDP
jgi:hypothetical protein